MTLDRGPVFTPSMRRSFGWAFLLLGMATPLVSNLVTSSLSAESKLAVTALSLLVLWLTTAAVWWLLAGGAERAVAFRLRMSRRDGWVAILVGLAGLLLVPLLSLLAAQVFGATELLESAVSTPMWLIVAGVATAAVAEEVLFRAAPMELLLGRHVPRWAAVAIPLLAFVACHLGSWNLSHIVGVVLPMGLLLGLLYLWRRSLIVNIIVHFIIDAPLIVIAVTAN